MKTRLFLLFLFVSAIIHGQNNYREAYIITLDNDTVEGYANFRTDVLNLSVCLFKKQIDETPIAYYPSDIAGYGFKAEDKLYVRDSILIDGMDRLVFLEYMVRGVSASLFYYEYTFINNDLEGQEQIFIIKDMQGSMHIITKKPDKHFDNLNLQKDVSFQKEIYRALGYNPAMLEVLKDTKFSRKSMIAAIKQYNDITCGTDEESCLIYRTKTKEYLKFKYAIYAGGRYFDLSNATYDVTKSPIGYIVGVQLLLSHPRTSDALSFVTDVSFSHLKKSYLDNKRNRYYDLSTLALDVNIGFRYIYPKGKIRPGFGLGLGRLYLFNQKIGTNDPRTETNKWLEDSYTEVFGCLSVDYMINNKQAIFLQTNIDTELDSFISSGEYNRDKYTISVKIGYKF